MTGYKGVIFDLDGTLIDSMHIWKKIDVDFLSKRGVTVPRDYMDAIAHLCAYDTAIYTINRFNLKDTPEALMKEWIDMAIGEYSSVKFKPGAGKYIEHLKKKSIKIAIATATEPVIVQAVLEGHNLKEYVDTVVTVSEVKRGKGYPDIYLKCAENMNLLPEECIVFEDIFMGIKGAKEGGFYTVGVYEECSLANLDKIKVLSDKFIHSFDEMI